MWISEKWKKVNKEKILRVTVLFLFSITKLYADVEPFGLPALCIWGKNPLDILVCTIGLLVSNVGFSAYLRHVFAMVIFKISERFLKDVLPEFIIMGSSVLLGGALSLFLLKEKSLVLYSFAAAEAITSAVFIFVFRKTKEVLRARNRGEIITEGELSFPLISGMVLCLAFSGIDFWRMSVSCMLLILFGMVASYKYRAPVSAMVNMAAGFLCLSFTPGNAAVSLYLILSGFCASVLKKYGKFLIPVTYMVLFPIFASLKVNTTSIYLEDITVASVIFLLLPAKIYGYFEAIPYTNTEEASVQRISEKISIASDTFYSISEIFSGMEFCTFEKEEKDAPRLTVESVCSDCVFKGKCSEEAEKVLRAYTSGKEKFNEQRITCTRKRELLSAFSGNYRVLRMENMLDSHIKEANAALSEEMICIAELLKGIACREETMLKRDKTAENELYRTLKKGGIRVKSIVAGKNTKGLMHVIINMYPCKGCDFCDEYVPSLIKETLGINVIRYGSKRCEACKVTYCETPALKIETAMAGRASSEISGDSVDFSYVDDEHFAVVLSDGMGTGNLAGYKSRAASKLLLELLSVGMSINSALEMVNAMLLRQSGRDFVTLDTALLNLETGEVEFSKNACASSYILKCGGRVIPLELCGSPLGIVGKVQSGTRKYRIAEGDFLIMVSDGVADCFCGKESLKGKIEEFIPGSVKNLADYILAEAVHIKGKNITDDMTVVAVGCIKKQKSGKTKEKGGQVYEKR